MCVRLIKCMAVLGGYLISGLVQSLPLTLDQEVSFISGVNVNDDQTRFQKNQGQFSQAVAADFGEAFSLVSIYRLRLQNESGLRPVDKDNRAYSEISAPWQINDSSELEWRELYLETFWGDHFFSLGKQQIVWGKTDGLKLLDVVNPQSFLEFVLEDFDESRIPVWAINAEFAVGESTLQLIGTFDSTVHVLPSAEGRYAFTTPRFLPTFTEGLPIDVQNTDYPSNTLGNSDYGLRWTSFVSGWDFSLNYFNKIEDFPVFRRTITEQEKTGRVVLQTDYERTQIVGGSGSTAISDFTLRSEVAYFTNKSYLNDSALESDGLSVSDELNIALGIDWFGISNSLISAQVFVSEVVDYTKGITRPRLDLTSTLLLEKRWFNETLSSEVMLISNFNDGDGLIRSRLDYAIFDGAELWVGLDVFYGDKEGLYGEFDENDRLELGLLYTF